MAKEFWFPVPEDELRRTVSAGVLEKAYDYVWDDRLAEKLVYRDRLGALVRGFRGEYHRAVVRRGPPLTSECSCEARGFCRHAAAVLLAFREDPGGFWDAEAELGEHLPYRSLYLEALFRPDRIWAERPVASRSDAAAGPAGLEALLRAVRRGALGAAEAGEALERLAETENRHSWQELEPLWEAWLEGDFGIGEQVSTLLLRWLEPTDRGRLDDFLSGRLLLLASQAGGEPSAAERYLAGRLLDVLVLLRESSEGPSQLGGLLNRFRWAWHGEERLHAFRRRHAGRIVQKDH